MKVMIFLLLVIVIIRVGLIGERPVALVDDAPALGALLVRMTPVRNIRDYGLFQTATCAGVDVIRLPYHDWMKFE